MPRREETKPEVLEAYRDCQRQLRLHRSPFLNAARRFEDPARRHAFYAAYLSLRVRGPSCLPRPVGETGSLEECREAARVWRDEVRLCHQGEPPPGRPDLLALTDAMDRFSLSMGPWLDMEQGLDALATGRPVADLQALVDRARQIGVAHSSVFLRIITAQPGTRRYRIASEVDLDELAHDPGVFAYIVRQMLELFPELDLWDTPRPNLPEDLMERHGIRAEDLQNMRRLRQAPRGLYEMMHDLSHVAWRFYQNGVAKLAQGAAYLPPQAISRVDRVLSGYKSTLCRIEEVRFAPAAMEAFARERRGRLGHGVTVSASARDEAERNDAAPPSSP